MRRSRSIPGLLLDLAAITFRRANPRVVASVTLAVGAGMIGAGVHALLARPAHSSRPTHVRTVTSARDQALRAIRARGVSALGSGVAFSPALAASAGGFGLAWLEGSGGLPHVHFARLSPSGERVGDEVVVTRGNAQQVLPNIVAAAGEFGITWTDVVGQGDEVEVGFARVGADGALRGEPMRVSHGNGLHFGSSLAWSGANYLMAWNAVTSRGMPELRAVQFAPNARPGDAQSLERNALPIGLSSATWDGREFAIAYGHWNDRADQLNARFVRLTPQGRAIGTLEMGTAPAFGGYFAATPSAEGTASAWTAFDEEGSAALYFARSRGARVETAARRIASAGVFAVPPSIAWNGTTATVLFVDDANQQPGVSMLRVGANGAVIGSATRISRGDFALEPTVVWTGREFAAAWTQIDGRRLSLRLARFDADGKPVAADREVASASERR